MKKLAIIAAAAATAITFSAAGAFAQAGGDFATADANKDGSVSMQEAQGQFPTLTDDIFKKADTNGDGKLDETEYAGLETLTKGAQPAVGDTSSSAASSSSSAAQ